MNVLGRIVCGLLPILLMTACQPADSNKSQTEQLFNLEHIRDTTPLFRLGATRRIDSILLWVKAIEANQPNLINRGPVTVERADRTYAVTATLRNEQAIQRIYCQSQGGRRQSWYYLTDNYLVPFYREVVRLPGGKYYENQFCYYDNEEVLLAQSRVAASRAALTAQRFEDYEPQRENDFRLDPASVRRSALDFISGR